MSSQRARPALRGRALGDYAKGSAMYSKLNLGILYGTPPLLLIVIAFWIARPGAITEENAARIQPGMTWKEVRVILGPLRDESGRSVALPTASKIPLTRRQWISRELIITV